MLLSSVASHCPSTAIAGKLDDFEREATKEQQRNRDRGADERSGTGQGNDIENDCLSICLQPIAEGIVQAAAQGGANSMHRVNTLGIRPDRAGNVQLREHGDARTPFVRVDIAYQSVNSDITARDVRAELGYGSLAADFRNTDFQQSAPMDRLSVIRFHLFYRMTFDPAMEIDLGFGNLVLQGNDANSGISFTTPLLIHPNENFGVEFRPAWAWINGNLIEDYDFAALIGRHYISLRLGYRWMRAHNETLNGPTLGVALRW